MALVAAWNFNEASGNATDVSGLSNTAAPTGTSRVAGQAGYGNAASFNGSSDFFTVTAANNGLGNLTSPITISAWVFINNLAIQHTIWDVAESPSSSIGFTFSIMTSGLLDFVVKGHLEYASTTASVATGAWHHIAALFDSFFDVTFFVDGVQKDSIAGDQAISVNTSQNNFIGASANNTTTPTRFWFDGKMDDLRIYNVAMNAAEITTDMNTPLANLMGGSLVNNFTAVTDIGGGAGGMVGRRYISTIIDQLDSWLHGRRRWKQCLGGM
jgi:hypothetical protein